MFRTSAFLFFVLLVLFSSAKVQAEEKETAEDGAEETPKKINEDAKAYCDDFAAVVRDHPDSCEALGEAMLKLVKEKRDFLESHANHDDPQVNLYCSLALEPALDRLLECGDDPKVTESFELIAEIESKSTSEEARRLAVADALKADPDLEAFVSYCDDLHAAITSGGDDCSAIVDALPALDAVVAIQSKFRITEIERTIIGLAYGRCSESLLKVPEHCQQDPDLLRGLGSEAVEEKPE